MAIIFPALVPHTIFEGFRVVTRKVQRFYNMVRKLIIRPHDSFLHSIHITDDESVQEKVVFGQLIGAKTCNLADYSHNPLGARKDQDHSEWRSIWFWVFWEVFLSPSNLFLSVYSSYAPLSSSSKGDVESSNLTMMTATSFYRGWRGGTSCFLCHNLPTTGKMSGNGCWNFSESKTLGIVCIKCLRTIPSSNSSHVFKKYLFQEFLATLGDEIDRCSKNS